MFIVCFIDSIGLFQSICEYFIESIQQIPVSKLDIWHLNGSSSLETFGSFGSFKSFRSFRSFRSYRVIQSYSGVIQSHSGVIQSHSDHSESFVFKLSMRRVSKPSDQNRISRLPIWKLQLSSFNNELQFVLHHCFVSNVDFIQFYVGFSHFRTCFNFIIYSQRFVWILFNFLLHARFFPILFYAFHAQFE